MASLNGATPGGWLEYARLMAQAGADALELNLYRIATDPDTTSADIERQAIETVREVKKAVTIPVHRLEDSVKHGTWFDGSSIEGFTRIAESDQYLAPDMDTFNEIPW